MLSSCVLISESTTVPHANYKIEASDPSQKQEALEVVGQVLHSLKFELQPNDWKVWETILDADRLAEKKQELRYKDNFQKKVSVCFTKYIENSAIAALSISLKRWRMLKLRGH